MSDQQILRKLKSNDSQSLEMLFQKYYEFLTKVSFYITRDKEVAEDLTQDLFVKVWDRRHQLKDIGNFKGYLAMSIKNSSLDFIASSKTKASHLGQYLKLQENYAEITTTETSELQNEIARSLDKLPTKCRLIFSMNRLEGLTNHEIADYLNISKRTVETQISKALKILREELRSSWSRYLSLIIF